MILRIHIPAFPLNQFVDNFVYFEGFNPEHKIDRFLPDGNTEIVIALAFLILPEFGQCASANA